MQLHSPLYILALLLALQTCSALGYSLTTPRALTSRWYSPSRRRSSSFFLSATEQRTPTPPPKSPLGALYLVGSGPGDPDLLTVQALRLIKNASLVVADRLISPEILALVQCELKIAQKRPGCAEEAQEELYQWVADALQQGRDVVRLKIGDPFLFGRAGEEVLYFRNNLGVEATIAPGISSSYSAPGAANIPLTHRGISNQVLISTGYGRDLARVDIPSYVADRTIVLLMAVGRLEEIAADMTSPSKGYPRSTPVAIVENATTPKQRTLVGTLETIAEIAKQQNARAPACIIVGDVVNVLTLDPSASLPKPHY